MNNHYNPHRTLEKVLFLLSSKGPGNAAFVEYLDPDVMERCITMWGIYLPDNRTRRAEPSSIQLTVS